MSLSEADWKNIERDLSWAYGSADLDVDGYRLNLRVERLKALRYVITVYVNGQFRGEWCQKDCPERARFMCKVERPTYKPKQRQVLRNLAKQFKRPDDVLNPDRKFAYYTPYWTSFAPLKRHLVANNQDIRIVPCQEKQVAA